MSPKIAFISGTIAPSPTHFSTHYLPRITAAIERGDHFVLGPSAGIDTLAFEHLRASGVPPPHISVFLNQIDAQKFGGRLDEFKQKGGKVVVVPTRNHEKRDEECTKASHYDILRYMTEEEAKVAYGAKYRPRISGTQKNEIRRKNGMGLVWKEETVQVKEEPKIDPRKRVERKIREAKILKVRMEAGEKLEVNQMAKVEKLSAWEKELEGLP